MTTINTIAGPFDRKRFERLQMTLQDAKNEGLSRDQIVAFEGQELLISFGEYLAEFLRNEFAKRESR